MLWQTILIPFILLTLVLVELALDGEGLGKKTKFL
jgi:hypothetical protein